MKVLHFITSLKIGGAEVALCNLLEYWGKDQDVEHIVAYLYDGPCVARIKKLGIQAYKITGLCSPYDILSLRRLAKLVETIRPDIIHSALWSANIMARFISKKYNIPLICDLHGDCRYHGVVRNFFERVSYNIPKRFVAVSYSVKNAFVTTFGKNVEKNTIVIQNGIDSKKFRDLMEQNKILRTNVGLRDDDFVIGTVGRLHQIKRYDVLIRSFARFLQNESLLRRKMLCFVGDGPERPVLEKLAIALNIKEHVKFFGSQNNVHGFYALFDCFVLSSQSEGLSIALLEALCVGLPVVTTCENEFHDVIVNEKNGFLVFPEDEDGLHEAFKKLYQDKNLLGAMHLANFDLVEKKFALNRVAQQYVDLYREILQDSHAIKP